ncbi:MAG TPA: oxidoreductase [Acidobacteriaceae bacterium]
MTDSWTAAKIPSQTGKLALVTGANSGVGFHAARHLALAGATVLLTGRDPARVEAARQRILAERATAEVHALPLDLASFASIRHAVEQFYAGGSTAQLDLLINNAGVMALPERRLTEDGFEMQIGTNHLGHFLLTGLLLPALLAAPAARIVTVSSIAHKRAQLSLDDLNAIRAYQPRGAYAQSKLANLLFGLELDRRLRASGARARSIVVHPGVSNTNIVKAGMGVDALQARIAGVVFSFVAQSDDQGSLPTLYGATAPTAEGGHYYGPDGFLEVRGYPREVQPTAQAKDPVLAEKLWKLSEGLTGMHYDFTASALSS